METNQILQTDVLDIIFENRNKMYGAYELRKSYNKRLKTAIAAMIGCCLFAFLLTVAAKDKEHRQAAMQVSGDIILQKAEPAQPPAPPPPPPPPPAPKPIATIQFTTPKLTNEPIETPPPAQNTLDNIAIGKFTNEGENSDVIAPPVEEQGVTKATPVVTEDYTKVFTSVQVQARFPGGEAAWIKFLERNLRVDLPAENGAPAGTYSVVVSFLVDKDGNVSEVKALNDAGYGTAAEAVRAIQNGPKWIPALQNGRNVIYRQQQTVTFKVEEAQ